MSELSELSNRIEVACWSDFFAAAPPDLGLRVEHDPAGTRFSSRGVDSVMFNRVIGLGVEAAATLPFVGAIRDAYRAERTARYFIHLCPHARPDALPGWLTDVGWQKYHRNWAKFVRGREAPPAAETSLSIRTAGPEDAEAMAEIIAAGFDFPDSAKSAFAAVVGRPGWTILMAFEGTQPAAAGGLFDDGEVATLAFAATRPEFRGRGAQQTLMARRIEVALDHGCRHIFTETGEAVEGEPNISYANMQRSGFSVTYVLENWTLPGVRW